MYLQVRRTTLISQTNSIFGKVRPAESEKKSYILVMGEMLLAPSSVLHVCLNFSRIPPLTSELAALERLKKTTYNLVSTLAPSFLFGSDKEDNHKISDEFEFRSASTTDCGVSCP